MQIMVLIIQTTSYTYTDTAKGREAKFTAYSGNYICLPDKEGTTKMKCAMQLLWDSSGRMAQKT